MCLLAFLTLTLITKLCFVLGTTLKFVTFSQAQFLLCQGRFWSQREKSFASILFSCGGPEIALSTF